MGFMWLGAPCVEVTTTDDGLSHLVAEAVYDRCLIAGTGRFDTLCGRLAPAAPLITQPGSLCRLCLTGVRHSGRA